MLLIVGWQMQKVAIGWEIYERTHSAMYLGYAGLVQFAPQILFMLIAGHITDSFNRKRVFMAALAFNAMAAIGLAINSVRGGSIFFLYACLFLYGTSRSFIMPSRAAFLPGIIPLEIFSTAVSWNSSGFEISSMAGPAIGGLLISAFQSPTLVYGLNAIGQLTFVALLAGLQYKSVRSERQPLTLQSLSAGLQRWNEPRFGALQGGREAKKQRAYQSGDQTELEHSMV